MFFLGQQRHLVGGRNDEFGQVEARDIHQRLARLQARDGEESLDRFGEALGFFQHAGDRLADGRVQPGFLGDGFQFHAHDRQRRAEFVGGVRGEAARVLERLVEPSDHAVEHDGQPFEFVVGADDGQAASEVVAGDFARGVGDLTHGAERPAHQGSAARHGDDHHQRQPEPEHGKKAVQDALARQTSRRRSR